MILYFINQCSYNFIMIHLNSPSLILIVKVSEKFFCKNLKSDQAFIHSMESFLKNVFINEKGKLKYSMSGKKIYL